MKQGLDAASCQGCGLTPLERSLVSDERDLLPLGLEPLGASRKHSYPFGAPLILSALMIPYRSPFTAFMAVNLLKGVVLDFPLRMIP